MQIKQMGHQNWTLFTTSAVSGHFKWALIKMMLVYFE